MAIHIIIDGYNLIRQSTYFGALDAQDMQAGREALIQMMAAYQRLKKHPTTIVFDGTDALPGSDRRYRVGGVEVTFSRIGESADAVIKRLAAQQREKALIVSSDRELISHCDTQGATTVASEEFESKVRMATAMDSFGFEEKTDMDGWTPTTKKKGPRKRLPRKKRRALSKMKKL